MVELCVLATYLHTLAVLAVPYPVLDPIPFAKANAFASQDQTISIGHPGFAAVPFQKICGMKLNDDALLGMS